MSRFLSFIFSIFIALGAVYLVFWIIVAIVNVMVPEPCSLNTDFCLDLKGLSLGKSSLMVTILASSLSLVGTLALVMTIVLSSRSASAATQALDHARKVSTIQLRPYVHILHPQIVGVINAPDSKIVGYTVRTTFKNAGVSFATSVRMNSNYWIGEGTIPNFFPFPSADQPDAAGSLVGDKEVFSQTPTISLSEMEFVFQGTKNLHVWCWVEYMGTLSDKVYRSEFHARMAVWLDGNGNIRSEYFFQPAFNGVDELSFRPPKF